GKQVSDGAEQSSQDCQNASARGRGLSGWSALSATLIPKWNRKPRDKGDAQGRKLRQISGCPWSGSESPLLLCAGRGVRTDGGERIERGGGGCEGGHTGFLGGLGPPPVRLPRLGLGGLPG